MIVDVCLYRDENWMPKNIFIFPYMSLPITPTRGVVLGSSRPENEKQKFDHGLSSFHLYLLKQRSYEHFKISHANHTNYLISNDTRTNKNQHYTSGPHPGYYPGLLDENG